MDAAALAGGAVIGAVASDVYEKSKHALNPLDAGIQHDGVETQQILVLLSELHRLYKRALDQTCDAQFVTIPLFLAGNATPFRLERMRYKHISLLTTTAFTIDCLVPAIGIVKFSMVPGWNALDLPDQTDLWIDAGGPATLSVVLYKGEDSLDIEGV